jgi:hypothetical protein
MCQEQCKYYVLSDGSYIIHRPSNTRKAVIDMFLCFTTLFLILLAASWMCSMISNM